MKHKVLILQETLSLYRIPIFNIVSESTDLTLGYFNKNESAGREINFKTLKLEARKFGSLYFHPQLSKICKNFDVVVIMGDLHCLSYVLLPFLPRKYKTVYWSFGTRASYTRHYNIEKKFDFVDRITAIVANKCESILFYMKEPIEFWLKNTKISRDKFFVAHNTVEVLPIKRGAIKKDSIIFIGSIYKAKGIDKLIESYTSAIKKLIQHDAFVELEKLPNLNIIGSGDELDYLKSLVKDTIVENKIIFHGAVYDEKTLSEYFSKALVSISPDQAGLSVLKSMGYGVPYITKNNAFTGGERLNIINNYNGIYFETYEELTNIIIDVFNNNSKYFNMGENAFSYYSQFCTPLHMARGIISSIEFALNEK